MYKAAAALLAAHLALGLWAAATHSATFDEPMTIADGAALWLARDGRLNPATPALSKLLLAWPAALAGARLPVESREWDGGYLYAFGERFLYWSGNDAAGLLLACRGANLALSLNLGVALLAFAARSWGPRPALAALALYAFSPTVLAHGSLATNDIPAALFVVLAVMRFQGFLDEPSTARALSAAALAAAGFLCKYSAALLGPIFACALALRLAGERDRRPPPRRWLRPFLAGCVLPGLAFLALYALAFPALWQGLFTRLGQVGGGVHPTFLLGANHPAGSRLYYAVAFLAKSTPTELAVAAGALWLAARRPRGLESVLCAIVLYLAAASLSHKQVGLRYILPVYPLLALAGARLAAEAARRRRGPALALLLAAGQAASALQAGPHWLAYFNGPAGGPAGGARLLGDSNVDWGQDLGRLADLVEERGSPEVVLSYFGTAAPEHHGLLAQQLLSHNAVQRRWRNSDRPEGELLAVSLTNLQGTYPGTERLAWLRELPPSARVGYGMYVWDISRDAHAHRRLAEVYAAAGDPVLAERERRRAEIIAREAGR